MNLGLEEPRPASSQKSEARVAPENPGIPGRRLGMVIENQGARTIENPRVKTQGIPRNRGVHPNGCTPLRTEDL